MTEQDQPAVELSFVRFLALLLRRGRLVLGLVVLGGGLGVLVSLMKPNEYAARMTILPNGAVTQGGGVAGIAAELGVRLPTSASAIQSPAFYADLLQSRALLLPITDTTFTFTARKLWWEGGDTLMLSGTLAELLGLERPTASATSQASAAELRSRMTVRGDLVTGIVSIEIRMPWAPLAGLVAQQVLTRLADFNLRTVQSQAAAERAFTEQRLKEAVAEQRSAEAALQRFLENNRNISNSPTLQFQQVRLERETQLRQGVVTTLTQSYELARIQEVRDTPLFTVMEGPDLPIYTRRLSPLVAGAIGGSIGVFLATLVLALGAIMTQERTAAPDAYAEFVAARDDVVRGLRRSRGKQPEHPE